MKHPLLSATLAALALTLGASGAFAFSTVTSNAAMDNTASARLADPDDILNSMSNQQGSGGGQIQFGGGSLQFHGSSSGSGGGNSPFLANPAAQTVPSLQSH